MGLNNKVYTILKELSGESFICDSQTLSDDLLLDSLNMVTLLLNIEETFSFRLQPEDMNPYRLVVVQDVIDLVRKYTNEK